jgi:hypothetical protein
MRDNSTQQLLRKAIAIVGREQLADALRTPASLVDEWITGLVAVPERKLLMLLDLLAQRSVRK